MLSLGKFVAFFTLTGKASQWSFATVHDTFVHYSLRSTTTLTFKLCRCKQWTLNRYTWIRVTGKVHPKRDHEGPQKKLSYNSTLFLTSAVVGGGWSTQRPDRFTPWEGTRYPLYSRLGGPQRRYKRERIISPSPDRQPRERVALPTELSRPHQVAT